MERENYVRPAILADVLKLAPKKVVNEHKKNQSDVIDGEFREDDNRKSKKRKDSK